MVNVKCSICNEDNEMPTSFFKKAPGIKPDIIPNICESCIKRLRKHIGDDKIKNFMDDINEQVEKVGKNNEIAGEIAEEITNKNMDSLLDELGGIDAPEEDKIKESFFRGAWMTLFLIANHHEQGFLEEEAKAIRDFHNNMGEK